MILTEIPKIEYSRLLDKRPWTALKLGDTDTGSIFMDSGAFGLYARLVANRGAATIGKHGRELFSRPAKFSRHGNDADYDWYSLKPGSEFRNYLDRYAKLINKCPAKAEVMWVTVDAIKNPKLSYQIHDFFHKEYGIWLVPVLHFGTSYKEIDVYLENPACDFLGLGGVAQTVGVKAHVAWTDSVFRHLCPASNKYLPLVRTHGFAMTRHHLMQRYPWWSVDSATWVKLAAYGWLMVPYWTGKGWDFSKPWRNVNISRRPEEDRKTKFYWNAQKRTVRQTDEHYDAAHAYTREVTDRWLAAIGLPLGKYDKAGNVTEIGAASSGIALAMANAHYFTIYESTFPPWPYPLGKAIRKKISKRRKTFDL